MEEKSTVLSPLSKSNKFSDPYKWEVFEAWYRAGKCSAGVLYNMIGYDPITKEKPTVTTLVAWVRDDFISQGELLDSQVLLSIEQSLVKERVEMLNRHAKVADMMQTMGIEYLEANRDNLKVPNAIKLLVEGLRVERESRGIPQALEKMIDNSDDELLKQLADIISKAPVEIEQIE